MKAIIAAIFVFLIFLVGVFGLAWAAEGNDFFLYKFFAPRQEAVRRQVFENTKSYRDGMTQELRSMQFEYVKADPKHQQALAFVILHRVSEIDESNLPPDVQSFVAELRQQQSNPTTQP